MHILTLGLNHETAPIEIRERAAVTADHLEEALQDLIARPGIDEAALLSTCNRTEIYCRQDNQDAGQLKEWISQYHDWPEDDVSKYLYMHPNRDAVRHAYRVASGLDSMVLGESQILGQMKSAFAIAHKLGTTGKILNRLFQSSFSVAKSIRTNTGVGTSAVSVAYAAVLLARQIFDSLEDQSVMLIGAGETIELVGKHLVEKGVQNIVVANRTIERGERLARELNGRAIALDELAEGLPFSVFRLRNFCDKIRHSRLIEECAVWSKDHAAFFMPTLAPEAASLPSPSQHTPSPFQRRTSATRENTLID